jgi:two-component system, LytTR family, response regulator
MIKCIIIDDHEHAIKVIEAHLKTMLEFKLLITFTDAIEAINYLEKNMVDLVFVDVDMPNMTGIELIENLRLKKGMDIPHFIITTGYAQHAIAGFDQGVVDYMIKPVTFKRFKLALDRYIANFHQNKKVITKDLDFFFLEIDNKKTRINFDDLYYIESAGNYCSLYKKDKRSIVYKSLNDIESLLDMNLFMRIHKSFIVALNKINIVGNVDIQITYNDTIVSLPLGRTFKDNLKTRLNID